VQPLSIIIMHDLLTREMLCILLLALGSVAQYTAVSRWGQAVVVVNNSLIVYGGKTDPTNAFSYTSAPTSNDILYLPLSSNFNASSPPWQLLSDSATAQGPTLAWHTLSVINMTCLMLFGGDPGPNSAEVQLDLPDSALLLSISNLGNPEFISETQSWTNQPIRRIHHTASSDKGKIWMVGGEKDDGTPSGLSDHTVFDPNARSSIQLSSTNGPPDLYGHASIVLPNGTMLIFGGFWASADILMPFNTIWAIDTTQSNPTWTFPSISNSNLPSPRRAFAATLTSNGKILIQGGADATLLDVLSDGWELDTTQDPMTWTPVVTLSELGPRYDHFAVSASSLVIFGWGYGLNGPADSPLHIYNSSSDSFTPTFALAPASTTAPNPTGTSTVTRSMSPTSSQNLNAASTNKSVTAIVAGVVSGVIVLMAGSLATAYYLMHHRRSPTGGRFNLLGGEGLDDDDANVPHVIPTVGMQREKPWSGPRGWFSGINKRTDRLNDAGVQRRNMLADEDTGDFDPYSLYNTGRKANGSSWSLQVGAGVRGMISGHKIDDFDSARASDLLLGDNNAAHQSRSRRQISFANPVASYRDPFEDPPIDEVTASDDIDADESTRLTTPNPKSAQTTLPSTFGINALPPLTEQSSRSSDPTSSSSSQVPPYSPVESHRSSSIGSFISRRRSSITNSPYTPILRTDTWWARFAPTSLLDRRISQRRISQSKPLYFRDPNPAPHFVAIRETNSQRNVSSPEHRRSVASLQTARTADSDAIERLGGMDVVQRVGTYDSEQASLWTISSPLSTYSGLNEEPQSQDYEANSESPISVMLSQLSRWDSREGSTPWSEELPTSPQPISSDINVSGRVDTYEQRVSQDTTTSFSIGSPISPNARNTRKREEYPSKNRVTTNYGLAPRPSLYVANPDHKKRSSSGS